MSRGGVGGYVATTIAARKAMEAAMSLTIDDSDDSNDDKGGLQASRPASAPHSPVRHKAATQRHSPVRSSLMRQSDRLKAASDNSRNGSNSCSKNNSDNGSTTAESESSSGDRLNSVTSEPKTSIDEVKSLHHRTPIIYDALNMEWTKLWKILNEKYNWSWSYGLRTREDPVDVWYLAPGHTEETAIAGQSKFSSRLLVRRHLTGIIEQRDDSACRDGDDSSNRDAVLSSKSEILDIDSGNSAMKLGSLSAKDSFLKSINPDVPLSLFAEIFIEPLHLSLRPSSTRAAAIEYIKSSVLAKPLDLPWKAANGSASAAPSPHSSSRLIPFYDCIFELAYLGDIDLATFSSRLLICAINKNAGDSWVPSSNQIITAVNSVVSFDFYDQYIHHNFNKGSSLSNISDSSTYSAPIEIIVNEALSSNPHLLFQQAPLINESHTTPSKTNSEKVLSRDITNGDPPISLTIRRRWAIMNNVFGVYIVALTRRLLAFEMNSASGNITNSNDIDISTYERTLYYLLLLSVDPVVLDVPNYSPLIRLLLQLIDQVSRAKTPNQSNSFPLSASLSSITKVAGHLFTSLKDKAVLVIDALQVILASPTHTQFSGIYLVFALSILTPPQAIQGFGGLTEFNLVDSLKQLFHELCERVINKLKSLVDLVDALNNSSRDNERSSRQVGQKGRLASAPGDSAGEAPNRGAADVCCDNVYHVLSLVSYTLQLSRLVSRMPATEREGAKGNPQTSMHSIPTQSQILVNILEKLDVYLKMRLNGDSVNNIPIYQKCIDTINDISSKFISIEGRASANH